MNMTLQLPVKYLEIEEDEMMYLDGGFSLPKGLVSLAGNALFTWATGGVGTLKVILKSFSMGSIKASVKKYLGGWLSTQFANRVCGIILGAIHGFLTWSVGGFLSTMWDRADGVENGWCKVW